MCADRAGAIDDVAHDRGDRDHRRVAGENRVLARMALDLGEQLALDLEILQRRLDDKVGVAHRALDG